MNNEEKILAMLQGITTRLDSLEAGQAKLEAGQAKLEAKVDRIQDDLDELKADHEETRGALNHLIEWSEGVGKTLDFILTDSKT